MRGVQDGTVASIMGLTSLMSTVEAYSDITSPSRFSDLDKYPWFPNPISQMCGGASLDWNTQSAVESWLH